jgi:hypothetical protein
MSVIPLGDASRRPVQMPVVTVFIILVNVIVFVLELLGGEPFVRAWSVIPAEMASGNHWVTILTSMFMLDDVCDVRPFRAVERNEAEQWLATAPVRGEGP